MKPVSFLDRLLRRKGKWIKIGKSKQQWNRCGRVFLICTIPYGDVYYCPCCGSLNCDPKHSYENTYIS